MVRILSCHHFRGQRIGRCDEAVGAAVAGDKVIVALQHQVNIYGRTRNDGPVSSGSASPYSPVDNQFPPFTPYQDRTFHDIGATFSYANITSPSQHSHLTIGVGGRNADGRPRTKSGSSSLDSIELETELQLTNSFATIDAIDSISYNNYGNYIICLEKREMSANVRNTSVRAYFHWEKNHQSKPMRARIAGLVSPTDSELEDDYSLMMIEIPTTSPATAVASCSLTGHLACISAESIINLFVFRAKTATGRVKVHYFDFDRVYAIEMPGFVPEKIYFLTDYIACMNSHKVQVIRVKKEDMGTFCILNNTVEAGKATVASKPVLFADFKMSPGASLKFQLTGKNKAKDNDSKVIFDSKNESIKVHLKSITRANRKRRSPSALIDEEFQDEIVANTSKVIFATGNQGLSVEDNLRLSIINSSTGTQTLSSNQQQFIQLGLYPIRMKDLLGGTALFVATKKEAFLYHLPSKRGCNITRVTNYPLTAPLVSFTFDSLFFHALTETGLESYTCRSLYNAVEDIESVKKWKNDCPFHDESPTLVGIRPFLRIRYMCCNDRCLSLLACPTSSNQTLGRVASSVSSQNDDSLWTIYTLDLPHIEMIYEDIIRTAQLQVDTNPESYFTLLCEAHVLIRMYMNSNPDVSSNFTQRYQENCRLIGFEYLKSSFTNGGSSASAGLASAAEASLSSSSKILSASSPSNSDALSSELSPVNISEEKIDKGVTYLMMGDCDLSMIFSPENSSLLNEPRNIPGFVRLIEVNFTQLKAQEGQVDNQQISPTLAPLIVDFLSNHGRNVLVDTVIQRPFLRECNSKRLIEILEELVEAKDFSSKETIALILTLVTLGGVESSTRSRVNELLSKARLQSVSSIIPKEAILEQKGQQIFLTDLAICFAVSDSQHLLNEMVFTIVNRGEITISDVMLAFAQAVNLNSDTHVQQCITKCLTAILEDFLLTKLKNLNTSESTRISNNKDAMSMTLMLNGMDVLTFSEEEKRAVHTVVRTYISNFSSSLTQNTQVKNTNESDNSVSSHSTENNAQSDVESSKEHEDTHEHQQSIININSPGHLVNGSVQDVEKLQIFARIPSFVNFLLSCNLPGGMITPQSQSLETCVLFPNNESRESFVKLVSLLSSNIANIEGVKDLVLTYLYKNLSQSKPIQGSPLFIILKVLSESSENCITTLLTVQPTTVLLYAKETFGRATLKWKLLVAYLKVKVTENPDSRESDMFATILESVYLHLANLLSPAELEQVLDKETEESTKFHTICKRVELANTYADMVITVSTEYLSQK